MALTDLIVPKWKHSDAQVRLQAVENLDETEKPHILEKLAQTDPQPQVRVAAVEKLQDTELLSRIANEEGPAGVAALKRLHALWHQAVLDPDLDLETRKALICKLGDERRLTAIACEVREPALRVMATERIQEPENLAKVARSHCGYSAGVRIVERIADPAILGRISRNASNKKVRKLASEKQARLAPPPEPDPAVETEAALEALCGKMETLALPETREAGERALSELETAWQALDPDRSHRLRSRYAQARAQWEAQLERRSQQAAARARLESLCQEAETQVRELEAADPDLLADLQAEFEALKRQWEESDSELLSEKTRKGPRIRFEQACQAFDRAAAQKREKRQRKQSQVAALSACCEELAELCERQEGITAPDGDAGDRYDAIQARWEESYFEGPETREVQARFEALCQDWRRQMAAAADKQAAEQETEARRLAAICEAVEAACEAENRAGLMRKVRNLQAEWGRLGELAPAQKQALADRFETACERFFQVQREHWENLKWERWANYTQKLELCQIMERLDREQRVENAAFLARDAQERWKQIGPVDREKSDAIWERFRGACDRVYSRCLEQKKALYQAAAAILARAEAGPEGPGEWKEAAEQVKAIQAQWSGIGPLPRNLEGNLWEEFQEACNRFFELQRAYFQDLDQQREANLEAREALCQQAEALADSEDWFETARSLRDLQAQWKAMGPVPKKAGERQWRRFQTACNRFFQRLEAIKPENQTKKEQLCQQAEALAAEAEEGGELHDLAGRFMELQREWKAIGPVPEDLADELWERFRKPCDAFFAKRKAFLEKLEAEQAENQAQKEALIAQAEALSDSTDWKASGETLKDLQRQWQTIGPAARKQEQALWQRFRGACDRFFQRRDRFFEQRDQQREENRRHKERLCLTLEVLARLLFAPEEGEEARSQAPAAQLSLALELKETVIVPGDRKKSWEQALRKVKAVQAEWKTIGPAPREAEQALWQRFRRAGDQFFAEREQRPASGGKTERPEEGPTGSAPSDGHSEAEPFAPEPADAPPKETFSQPAPSGDRSEAESSDAPVDEKAASGPPPDSRGQDRRDPSAGLDSSDKSF